jgi:NitT/TauT family transport system substrate-binding protein
MIRRGHLRTAALLAALLLPAACGSSDPERPPRPDTPLIVTELAAQAAAAPLEPYPSQGGDLPVVKVARSVPALSFAPLDVARAMNFFEYVGVKVEYQELQAGASLAQAVLGGSVELGSSASTEMAAAVARGTDFRAIENVIMMTLQVCVRKDWAAEHGVGPEDDLKARLAALKGAKIAISGPGSVSDRAMRWMVDHYGRLDSDNDVEMVQVGGAAAMSTALDEGRVQAFMLSSPNCQQTRNGMVLVQPTEVEEFKNYVHEVLYGRAEWIEENPDLARRVATAVAMGNNFVRKHPETAIKLLQKTFSKVDPTTIEDSFNSNILPNIPANGTMDEAMWESTNRLLIDTGLIDKPLDVSEGGVWTNSFISIEDAVVH